MDPALNALQAARQAPPMGGAGDDPGLGSLGLPTPGPNATRNPMGTDKQTKEVFVDRKLFEGMKVKKGDRIEVCGMITTLGNVIGFIPDKVEPDDEKDEKDEDGEFDPDMDDELDEEGEPEEKGSYGASGK